jgi:hypothetical protein
MFEVDGVDLRGRGFWELQALSLDEAKELMSKDFGRELVKLAVAHMTHFTFGVVNSTGDAEIRSATCFFLKTTSKLLVVTAKHVISAYRQALTEDPATRCQIGSLPFKPEDRLVGVGTKADIATLSISEGEVEEVKAKAGMPVWRRDEQDGQSYALRLTAAGAKAIAVNPDDDASPTGDEERSPTEGDQAPTSAESDRTAAGVLVAPSAQALATPRTPRVGTKLATAIELLRATEGATVGELSQAMCWLPPVGLASSSGLTAIAFAPAAVSLRA